MVTFNYILIIFEERSLNGLTLGMFSNCSDNVKKQRSSVRISVLQHTVSYRFPRGCPMVILHTTSPQCFVNGAG